MVGGVGEGSAENVFPRGSMLSLTRGVSSATRKAGHKCECGSGREVHRGPLLRVPGDVGGFLSTFSGGKGNGGRLCTHLSVLASNQEQNKT